MPSTTMRAVSLAAAVGLLVVLVTWMIGPSVFAGADEPERVVTATIAEPAPCADANAVEKVTFTDGGKKTTANLPACGHDRGEELRVAVSDTDEATGTLTVRSADTSAGYTGSRQSLGLLLVALSCIGGGVYAYLVARTRRRAQGPQVHRTERAAAA